MTIPSSMTFRLEFGDQDSNDSQIGTAKSAQSAAPAPTDLLLGAAMLPFSDNAGAPTPSAMLFDAEALVLNAAAPVPSLDGAQGLVTGFADATPSPHGLADLASSALADLAPPRPLLDGAALGAAGFSDSNGPPVPDVEPGDLKGKADIKK